MSNRQLFPTDGFIMKNRSNGWIDSKNNLAITNNQHATNRYSKAYQTEDNICKLSGGKLP